MATLKTRFQISAGRLLIASCMLAGCGSGGGAADPTPIPYTPRAVATPVPGAPTAIPPRFPPSVTVTPTPTPTTMTFTFRGICAATQDIRLRLFDPTLNLIYLDGMRDYVITSSVRSVSIACHPGDEICYGGQVALTIPTVVTNPTPTPNTVTTFGVGLNNDRTCSNCCFTCAGIRVPEIDLSCS